MRADDDDVLIFGNVASSNSQQHELQQRLEENEHISLVRRAGSIPNLVLLSPVNAMPATRRYVKTVQTFGPPLVQQQQQQQQQANLTQDFSQIQSRFNEIFGVQRHNECYSTQSLGQFEAPITERFFF